MPIKLPAFTNPPPTRILGKGDNKMNSAQVRVYANLRARYYTFDVQDSLSDWYLDGMVKYAQIIGLNQGNFHRLIPADRSTK